MKKTHLGKWEKITECWLIYGKRCNITLEPRPHYCDRGNWLAKLFPHGKLAMEIDGQDGWPRYFMDLDRAKLECEDWLKKRGQLRLDFNNECMND
jgi:hypothetical protein